MACTQLKKSCILSYQPRRQQDNTTRSVEVVSPPTAQSRQEEMAREFVFMNGTCFSIWFRYRFERNSRQSSSRRQIRLKCSQNSAVFFSRAFTEASHHLTWQHSYASDILPSFLSGVTRCSSASRWCRMFRSQIWKLLDSSNALATSWRPLL